MLITHKIRIYPNKTLTKQFNELFGYSRYCYNRGLEIWNNEYKLGNKPNFRKVRDISKQVKNKWEKEYSPNVLDSAIEDLERGFKNFFSKRSRYPKFKSKRKSNNTFRFNRKNDSTIRIKDNKLFLPKMKYGIKLSELPRFNGTIKLCTISKKANTYYASLTIDTNEEFTRDNTNNNCGIDLGLKTFITLSDNTNDYSDNYPSKLKALQYKIKYLNKLLSKKSKGSNNRYVMITKLQKAYLDFTNLRNDYLNKIVNTIVFNYDTICIEDLNVKGMLSNKKLSSKVYQALFYTFKVKLTNKCSQYGNSLVIANRWFPSTQTCSNCGQVKGGDNRLGLSNRTYTCNCGLELDRDINASRNLRDYGLSKVS